MKREIVCAPNVYGALHAIRKPAANAKSGTAFAVVADEMRWSLNNRAPGLVKESLTAAIYVVVSTRGNAFLPRAVR